jgi:hypothetical protein
MIRLSRKTKGGYKMANNEGSALPNMDKNLRRIDEMLRVGMITVKDHRDMVNGVSVYLAGWAVADTLVVGTMTDDEAYNRGYVYNPFTGKRVIPEDAKFHPMTCTPISE